MADQPTPTQQISLFTPLQQQLLTNFSSIMAMATLIGGIFVNIYILNTLRVDVDELKKDSARQSRNIAIIMDRLGVKEQTDAGKAAVKLVEATKNAGHVFAVDNSQADASATLKPTPPPTPEPTPVPTITNQLLKSIESVVPAVKLPPLDVDDILD